MCPKHKPPCEPSNSFSLTPHPSPHSHPSPQPGTPLLPPCLADLYTEEAGFSTSPAHTRLDLWGPGKGSPNPARSGEWEVAVRCPHWPCSQAGLNCPYPCAEAGISCPEAQACTQWGLSVAGGSAPRRGPPLSCQFSRPFLCGSLLPRLLFWSLTNGNP